MVHAINREKIFEDASKGSVSLNLGAGSCQVYDSDGSEFNRMTKCREFIKNLFDISSVTTLRDGLSKRILNDLGFVCSG